MYAKVFTQIFDSTIADNWKHRHVFEDLLKLCDADGVVDMTPRAIAARTRMPLAMVADAIKYLSSPDPHSRSKEEEGRRLIPIDPARNWGWKIVNHASYREIKTNFDRTTYMRDYMRERRSVNPVKLEVNKNANMVLTSASVCVSVPEGGVGEGMANFTIPKVPITDASNIAFKLKHAICDMYRRDREERWSCLTEQNLARVSLRKDPLAELSIMEAHRANLPQKDRRFFPHSAGKLLEKWDDVLDSARSAKPTTCF